MLQWTMLQCAGLLEVLQTSGALQSEAAKFEESLQGSDNSSSSSAAASAAWLHVEDVVSDSAAEQAKAIAGGW
jgi:hypothetical protein